MMREMLIAKCERLIFLLNELGEMIRRKCAQCDATVCEGCALGEAYVDFAQKYGEKVKGELKCS